MTNRRIPTRVVETGRVVRGSSGQGVGWLQPIAERVRGLQAQLEGIRRRLSSPMVDGVPAAVTGELTFKANTQEQITVNYPASPVVLEPGDIYPYNILPLLCNPIVKAGQTYRIPIVFPPPGVLSVQNLVVTMEAGMTEVAGVSQPFIEPLNDYLETTNGSFNDFGRPYFYTWQQQILGQVWRTRPFLPFFWNIIDEKSGRQYAQDWMPHGALLNTRANGRSAVEYPGQQDIAAVAPDSELFDFDTPWLFERDAQVSFLFRPIMDLYQLDAAATINFNPPLGPVSEFFPYGRLPEDVVPPPVLFDDRNQGKRNQQLTVRVEMHGIRHYDRQDVLKEGAYV